MRRPKDIIIGNHTLEEILEWHNRWQQSCGFEAKRADLHGADIHDVDLSYVNLSYADLSYANLSCANLHGANLFGADLRGANLRGANLYCNILLHAECRFIEYRKGKVLTQNIIGYKKCLGDHGCVIVTLEIPRGAIVFSINGYKFRTNKAKVIGIDGADRAISNHQYMSYYVGDEFTIYNFNCEYNIECDAGIHFFMTREEAENYTWS